ncbi:MAG: hypothetical protein LC136_01555 [Burkholderiales bacterium]|nr:hypothetical protein [Burkholderiales bacterium]
MIRDKASEFSSAQDVKGTGTTTVSTNYLDTEVAGGDVSVGEPIEWAVTVTTAASGGTSIEFKLYTDDDPGFGTESLLDTTGAIAVANLVKGYTISRRVPRGAKRYLRMKAVTVGAVAAANVDAGLVKHSDAWRAAPAVGFRY